MYKIVSVRYESVIQKNFARKFFLPPPPQSQIRSYGLGDAEQICDLYIVH